MQVKSPVPGMARICTVQIGALAVSLSLLSMTAPAKAQPLPPENQRTVDWYASHPSERAQVRRICLNDPGHLEKSPDCINASRGDLEAASRSAQRPIGSNEYLGGDGTDNSSPDTPEYWTKRPADRRVKLFYCGNLTPDQAIRAECGPARESLRLEQHRGPQ